MTATHTLRVTLPHGDPDAGAEIECEIAVTAGLEFMSATPIVNGEPCVYEGNFADMKQTILDDLARAWLASDAGQEIARRAVGSET